MMNYPFKDIEDGVLESLNGLQAQFSADGDKRKVDLMCGVYQTDEGTPFVLPSVKVAKQMMFDDPTWNHEYPSSHLGTQRYRDLSTELYFGADSPLTHGDRRMVSMQALGASGACHMGALFLKRHYGPWKDGKAAKVYIPAVSWANHPNVFKSLGLETAALPYYNPDTCALDFTSLCSAIKGLPAQSVIVLQTSANNPTGCDPTSSQWRELAEIFHECGHLAFLDGAYLGFATGSPHQDCESIRIFAQERVPLMLATTYGKAFGLYGERVGMLFVPAPSIKVAQRIEKQMKLQARSETGAMPAFGAKIVETILGDVRLRSEWEADVRAIARQLCDRRERLRSLLEELGTPGKWRYITEQAGMFSYFKLSPEQIQQLRDRHHIYLQDTGRVSIAGLNSSNVEHVARSIDSIMREALI